jgi:hypothetical protein
MFGSVAPILEKDDDESPFGDASRVIYLGNFRFVTVNFINQTTF